MNLTCALVNVCLIVARFAKSLIGKNTDLTAHIIRTRKDQATRSNSHYHYLVKANSLVFNNAIEHSRCKFS
jgi:hypothetical protein